VIEKVNVWKAEAGAKQQGRF